MSTENLPVRMSEHSAIVVRQWLGVADLAIALTVRLVTFRSAASPDTGHVRCWRAEVLGPLETWVSSATNSCANALFGDAIGHMARNRMPWAYPATEAVRFLA